MHGEERTYVGITEIIRDDSGQSRLIANVADEDYENICKMTPHGVPAHRLRVKIGSIMMIVRNVSVKEGLCNGTRVQILAFGHDILHVRILTGSSRGKEYALTPMQIEFGADASNPDEGPIKAKRIQFPLRPGSVMTINKAQGMILIYVTIII